MTTDSVTVPLPFSPYIVSQWGGPEMQSRSHWTAYTAEQMRQYARDCIAAAPPAPSLSDEACDGVIEALHDYAIEYAIDFNEYEYGLPTNSGRAMQAMRAIIRERLGGGVK